MDAQYHTARSAVTQWLKLSEECPAASRAAFQAYFVLQCVPSVHFANLLGESRQQKFEPRAEAAIRKIIKAGAMANYLMDVNGVKALATMPSKEELLSKLLGTMQAPIAQFVRTLNEVPTKFVRGLAAVKEAKEKAGS